MAEFGDLVQDLMELICQHEKETCDHHTQQVHWIGSLENHIRKLNYEITSYQCTIQDINSHLQATGLLDPKPTGTGFLGAHYRSDDVPSSLPSSSTL